MLVKAKQTKNVEVEVDPVEFLKNLRTKLLGFWSNPHGCDIIDTNDGRIYEYGCIDSRSGLIGLKSTPKRKATEEELSLWLSFDDILSKLVLEE